MDDIQSLTLDGADVISYADDTAILFSAKSWSQAKALAEDGLVQIAGWLQRNLLTLNVNKTTFLRFSKTMAGAPKDLIALKIHRSCGRVLSDTTACACESIACSDAVKYLGIVLDDKLTFKQHFSALSGRIRKVIWIMKGLNRVASDKILRMVYIALCQSLLSYCISVWGGAAKTSLLLVERAQRSVLKVMLQKPRWYSTDMLYRDAGVLSVRRVYILKAILLHHKQVINDPSYVNLIKKRVFQVPKPVTFSKFADRFGAVLFPRIYNRAVSCSTSCNIINKSTSEARLLVEKWLLPLTYIETEQILDVMI